MVPSGVLVWVRFAGRLALTGDHLASLLAALGPAAADRYEQLRWRLVRLFRWERCVDADTLADEALDRLARRLAENEPIGRIESYLFGIARLLLREEAARNIRQRTKLAELGRDPTRLSIPASEELAERLNRCLATLEPDQRRLLLAYYEDKQRERLAVELSLTMNALRNRELRLRERLEKCVMSGQNHSLEKEQ